MKPRSALHSCHMPGAGTNRITQTHSMLGYPTLLTASGTLGVLHMRTGQKIQLCQGLASKPLHSPALVSPHLSIRDLLQPCFPLASSLVSTREMWDTGRQGQSSKSSLLGKNTRNRIKHMATRLHAGTHALLPSSSYPFTFYLSRVPAPS